MQHSLTQLNQEVEQRESLLLQLQEDKLEKEKDIAHLQQQIPQLLAQVCTSAESCGTGSPCGRNHNLPNHAVTFSFFFLQIEVHRCATEEQHITLEQLENLLQQVQQEKDKVIQSSALL